MNSFIPNSKVWRLEALFNVTRATPSTILSCTGRTRYAAGRCRLFQPMEYHDQAHIGAMIGAFCSVWRISHCRPTTPPRTLPELARVRPGPSCGRVPYSRRATGRIGETALGGKLRNRDYTFVDHSLANTISRSAPFRRRAHSFGLTLAKQVRFCSCAQYPGRARLHCSGIAALRSRWRLSTFRKSVSPMVKTIAARCGTETNRHSAAAETRLIHRHVITRKVCRTRGRGLYPCQTAHTEGEFPCCSMSAPIPASRDDRKHRTLRQDGR